MADLHVLEDLRGAESGGPEQPGRRVARGHQHDPRKRGEPAVKLDDAADVVGVARAEIAPDLVADLLEGFADLVDLLWREAVQRVIRVGARVGAVDARHCSAPQSAISICPSGAFTQVRIGLARLAVELAGSQVANLSRLQLTDTGVADPKPAAEWQDCARLLAADQDRDADVAGRLDVGDPEADRPAGAHLGIAAGR